MQNILCDGSTNEDDIGDVATWGLAGFALLLCAGLGCAALGWGGLSFTVLACALASRTRRHGLF